MAFNTKIDYLQQRFLNDVNDQYPGGMLRPIIEDHLVDGQLGDIIYLTNSMAAKLSDTNVGTLYEGFYQYVQFKSGSTASNARGQVVFWDTFSSYIVTPDVTAATMGLVAGITLTAVTKGYYGWIQISGKATVQCAATVTDTTSGDLALVTQTPANTVDAFADATAFATAKLAKSIIGVFLEAPANGALKLCQLRYLGGMAL
jgi:hypothetical protein